MRNLQAIILAAGEGTRMKSELPKVLHPICGRPMISYALDVAASAGVTQPIVVLGHGADQIKPRLPKEAKPVIQTQRLGTGDAVLVAKKALSNTSGALLILYADTPLLRRTTVQKLVETHFKTGATCTLLTAHLADPSGYGRILRNETGQVAGIVEEAEANAAERAIREINIGTLICNTQALLDALAIVKPSASKKEIYLTEAITHISRQEGAKIQVSRVEEVSEALGINSRAELARAIGVIRQRIIDAHLHNGVTIEDPDTTLIDQGVTIGSDTVIHPCTVIETGVAIGKRCSIGPFARLRSGTTIAEETRVGNFAELVRTKVGPRVRLNHMSYFGDATIEEGVNVGAGSITANYDGKDKHPTHIGKGAFIGVDTVLIAPVKVGQGATTGAGSVVPKGHDVPPRGVVVGVPAHPMDASGKGEATDGKTLAKGAPKSAPAASSAATKTNGHRKPAKPSAVKRVAARVNVKSSRRPVLSKRRTVKLAKRRVVKTAKRPAARRPSTSLRTPSRARVEGRRKLARARR